MLELVSDLGFAYFCFAIFLAFLIWENNK